MLKNRKRSEWNSKGSWIPEQLYQPLQTFNPNEVTSEVQEEKPSVLDRLLNPVSTDYTHLLPDMTFRDRTSEFANAARHMQSRSTNGGIRGGGNGRRERLPDEYALFMRASSQVGRDIAATFVKLEKLALLAKKKSLFDDRPVEIQELTYIIKQDINSLNKQIAQLQQLSRDRNPTTKGGHLATHSSSIVVSLQSRLASMSNDFKQVLEVRTENLKQQKSRREQFSSSAPVRTPGATPSLLLADDEAAQARVADTAIDMGAVQQQRQLLMLQDEQDSYLQERADTMQNIESTIVELGGIFQQLAHMVQEQDEVVERIDANVDNVGLNVEAAHTELLKYFQSISGNRWLMIKVFGVLIVFFFLFVVIAT